ncbi:glycoside hydrolase family 3 protein [Rhodococcoides fascians]|uniref:glycoside hydrolase family 3 protein n=1 Tax=Rhodococcoides fascians TaxID=1828 RepID=UPI00068FC0FF|nr:glycoside hydrolase family 3 C-terminal domain-containing protein [Rhodococcus fascians]
MSMSRFQESVDRVRQGAPALVVARDLLEELEPAEKLWLLDGDLEFWSGLVEMLSGGYNAHPTVKGEVSRLGIPGLRFTDGPRGCVIGGATAFPVSMARGATWDLALESEIGLAIGVEIRSQGANFYGGVCINLPRHPAWGRIQETYGEDSYLLGEFGAALVSGIQRNAMAVAKHFALNSMENARFKVNVTADEATLREVYLPHFRRVVDAGVYGIMSAYNSVNGEWMGQNHQLLQDILRDEWGFEGIVMSDYLFGVRDGVASLRAGLDVEGPFRHHRAADLPAALEDGKAAWSDVDRAALRILSTQLKFYASDLDDEPGPDVMFSADHRALSRRAATEAAVLLKNDLVDGVPLLPLNADTIRKVAVIGRLADRPNTGDNGSSHVSSPEVITPLRGLSEAIPGAAFVHVDDDDAEAAAAAAADADVAVVVVGYTAADEGEFLGMEDMGNLLAQLAPPPPGGSTLEQMFAGAGGAAPSGPHGGDRKSLRLRPIDVDIILRTAAANPRTVVIIVTAGAVITEEWRPSVPAVLLGWYNGSEGGAALADILLGSTDVMGRLPYSIPTSEDHLPAYRIDATEITYDRWHGQRLLDRDGNTAAFPLGFGLSYTSFSIDSIELSACEDEAFTARVEVTNTGPRDGRHVVQLYGLVEAADFPVRVLLGFSPIWVQAGETSSVVVAASKKPMQRWTADGLVFASPQVTVEAAAYSGDPAAVTATLALGNS